MKLKMSVGACLFLCLGMMSSPRAYEAPGAAIVKTAAAAVDASSAPIVALKDSRFHFEAVKEGTVITHEFVINNTGAAPLRG